mmetsp:Transcript_6430/g.8667  ORF Transcript_6430/g.8667 Transcript_6430/m.8667 type:complete len:112 (-) Transcript_6430:246-581(-)
MDGTGGGKKNSSYKLYLLILCTVFIFHTHYIYLLLFLCLGHSLHQFKVLANHRYAEPADVYSFGIILWEMLTAECPYEGMSPIQCALAVLNKNARPKIPEWYVIFYFVSAT